MDAAKNEGVEKLGVKWNEEIDNRRIELLKINYTYAQVAEILSNEFDQDVSAGSVDGRCQKTQTTKKDLLNLTTVQAKAVTQNQPRKRMFPEECYKMDASTHFPTAKKKEMKDIYDRLTNAAPRKILSLSDLHSPYMDFDAIEIAVGNNLDADICILNGDVFNGDAMSSFVSFKDVDFEYELNQVYRLLDVLSEKFKEVIWVGGNHDMMRFKRFVIKNGGKMASYFMQHANPMNLIAEKYPNLTIIDHDWVQIGDVLFAHPEDWSAVDMKSVVTVDEKFRANACNLFPNPHYTTIVMGHTHAVGKIVRNGNLLIEQGCLTHQQDYKFLKPSKRRWETAFAVIYLDENGRADFNNSNFVLC